jgi:hypothetical protein
MVEKIEREELRQEKNKRKRREKRHIRNSHLNVRFHQLVNKHYASHCLGNEAAKLLKEAAKYLHQLDSLIKESKNKRKRYKESRQFTKADDISQLINQLSNMYGNMKKDRDHFLGITRTLNQSTATLNLRIRSSCGNRGQKWHQRQQQR